ncbi:MAG: PilZ domain-containing protein [Spirochaetaceae bacterium]|jgi:hypothetical protein|nr:PilZ domain-containing protein [Spirochaetaceae bacterium]
MKLMMVLGAGDICSKLEEFLGPLAIETIVYRHIQKAMDNIEEVNPDVIIIDTRVFPRHWKSFVQFIRKTGPGKQCPVILIKGENFSSIEQDKAVFLGVDAVVSGTLTDKGEIATIQSIINAVIPDGEHKLKMKNDAGSGRFDLLITHPITGVLLSGEVKTVSEEGLIFYPDHASLAETIPLHAELYACSFRAGDTILSPVLRLVKRDTGLYFTFVSFPGNEQVIFNNYYARTG